MMALAARRIVKIDSGLSPSVVLFLDLSWEIDIENLPSLLKNLDYISSKCSFFHRRC